ncbi:MAG: NADH-quinone oxidoreductase subunit N [Planctomycetota bacterium]|nr:MAG: NADH-quinone oxidoreductase subunit N [Planctomycetota bacterium]
MNSSWVLKDLRYIGPELALVAALLVVILVDLTRLKRTAAFFTLVGLFAAAWLTGELLWPDDPAASQKGPVDIAVFRGAYAVDGFAGFFKLAFLGAAMIVGIFSIPAIRDWSSGKGEFFTLLLSCTFGMMLMAGANDLLMMYLTLEFASITSYIMAGFLRKNRKSSEASLKYIIYGAATSGFMIYGMTFLYGLTGSLNVTEIGLALASNPPQATLTLIMSVLIMAGFGYKIAAVPFHMWCPDVYEGAPTPVTAFFSVGPKAAGFAMLARFLHEVYPAEPGGSAFEWKLVIALLAVLTMAVGNFGALQQQNLKRMLAYSSIAHAGYLLVAFVAFTPGSLSALLFYIVIYVMMNLGAFLVVLVLEQKYGIETVDGCRGMGWRSPLLGAVMTVFLFALTGLPPTAGFAGKFLVFSEVIKYGIDPTHGLGVALVVIALIFSVVSLFYYMRISAAMYLAKPREGEAPEVAPGPVYGALLLLLAVGTLALGIWWGPLLKLTQNAKF